MIPTNDDEWTPKEHNIGLLKVQWKLHNLSRVLLQVGSSENANSPFIGCSEIENRGVLEDLIKESNFVNKGMELSILIPLIREGSTWLYYIKTIFPTNDVY
jgi:hypothetical protein